MWEMSACLLACLLACLSSCLPAYLPGCFCTYNCQSACPFSCLSSCLLTCLATHLAATRYLCLPIALPSCMSVPCLCWWTIRLHLTSSGFKWDPQRSQRWNQDAQREEGIHIHMCTVPTQWPTHRKISQKFALTPETVGSWALSWITRLGQRSIALLQQHHCSCLLI